jgi:hypothetical protein
METVSVRHEDGTVDIFERADGRAVFDAERLETLYWDEIRRGTLGCVRYSSDQLRLFGVWPSLLRFGPLVGGRRAVVGGLMAGRAGGTVAWRADGVQTSIAVEGFAPFFRGPFWRVQLAFHYLVGRRFVARVAREVG